MFVRPDAAEQVFGRSDKSGQSSDIVRRGTGSTVVLVHGKFGTFISLQTRVMRIKGMNIQSVLGQSGAQDSSRGSKGLAAGVAVSELRALQSVDLVAGPELLDDSIHPRFQAQKTADLDRLGPMKTATRDQKTVVRSLGRFLRNGQEQVTAVSSKADDVVKEARLRAVVEQIHNMRTLIRDSKINRS
jgi:hypothetical protein